MTQKALEYTMENKRGKAQNLEKKLWLVVRAVEGTGFKLCTSNMMHELKTATKEFELIINELANLYSQDLHGVFKAEATLMSNKLTLRYALELLDRIKNAMKSDKLSDTSPVKSRNSHCSCSSLASTSSSLIKMRAAAEAAATKEQADFEKCLGERNEATRSGGRETSATGDTVRKRRRHYVCK